MHRNQVGQNLHKEIVSKIKEIMKEMPDTVRDIGRHIIINGSPYEEAFESQKDFC